jgi:probable HAF family extracellular repeat protein
MRLLCLGVAALLAAVPNPAAAAIRYSITELAPLPGSSVSGGYGVNSQGDVAGYSVYEPGYGTDAVRWDKNGVISLVAGGTNSLAIAINDAGTIVGYDFVDADYAYEGLIATVNGGLQHVTAAIVPMFTAISSNGKVAGYAGNSINDFQAALYSNGSLQLLGVLGGTTSQAWGVNDSGEVVGTSTYTGGGWDNHAFLYQSGMMNDLGTLGGSRSYGYGINNPGTVVGEASTTGDASSHAFVYRNGVMSDLGTFGDGSASSWASSINDAGLIVGASQDVPGGDYRAAIWQDGHIHDLNNLIDPSLGWTLQGAEAVSSNGRYITGYGVIDGESRGFLLQLLPSAPEPASWAMMLAGFGAIGCVLRRRRPALRPAAG